LLVKYEELLASLQDKNEIFAAKIEHADKVIRELEHTLQSVTLQLSLISTIQEESNSVKTHLEDQISKTTKLENSKKVSKPKMMTLEEFYIDKWLDDGPVEKLFTGKPIKSFRILRSITSDYIISTNKTPKAKAKKCYEDLISGVNDENKRDCNIHKFLLELYEDYKTSYCNE
jgi:hypothetical protein